MRTFINPNDLPQFVVASRIRVLDPFARVQDREGRPKQGGIWHYIEIESTLTDEQIENALAVPKTTNEQNDITEYSANWQNLRNTYTDTLTQLQTIENYVNPSGTEVVAAVKYLAKTIRLILRIVAKIYVG